MADVQVTGVNRSRPDPEDAKAYPRARGYLGAPLVSLLGRVERSPRAQVSAAWELET